MMEQISFPRPTLVNGFVCRNSSDEDMAKKHIDPAHPLSGPYGINADTDPTRQTPQDVQKRQDKAVQFGGALAGTDRSQDQSRRKPMAYAGTRLDIRA